MVFRIDYFRAGSSSGPLTSNERPFLLIPVGYPADGCTVPRIQQKSIEEVMVIR